jgi:hypothetical protein
LKKRINPDDAGKPVGRTFAGGLRADAFDLHSVILVCWGRMACLPTDCQRGCKACR